MKLIRRLITAVSQSKARLGFALVCCTSARAAEWNALGEVHELGAGITPGICTDAKGGIHVVSMANGGIEYRHAASPGKFGPPEAVPVPEGPAVYNSPHLACDATGIVHLVFERDFTGTSRKAWYSNRQNGKWRQPVLVLDRSGTEKRINYPRLAVQGTTVYVGAFVGGGSMIGQLVDVTTAPRLARLVDTPLWAAHPLIDPAGGVIVVGRNGPRGHRLQHYSAELEPQGEGMLLSPGTPNKTGEPTAAIVDTKGTVHAVGVTRATATSEIIWYNTSTRAAAGHGVVSGPEIGDHVKEYTFPVLMEDARGIIHLSYRHHGTGEARITTLDRSGEKFAPPVTIAPRTTQRLRWNPHLAAAPGGGVYVIWEDEGKILLRSVGAAQSKPNHPASIEVSSAPLLVPSGRLLVNLMVEGRMAWFSWMGQQRFKPKLEVDWVHDGRHHARTWQHGLDGSPYPQALFLMRGNEPGNVRWGGHAEVAAAREAHKHHFFSKDRPARCGFIKADISEIPAGAVITRAALVLHIHDKEGLKAMPGGDGTGHFRHVHKEWDWDHITFTHYAAGKPWSTPREEYPFLGDGDVSPILWSLRRQEDVAAHGYHKNGIRDYPLDLTAYVRRLQELRPAESTRHAAPR